MIKFLTILLFITCTTQAQIPTFFSRDSGLKISRLHDRNITGLGIKVALLGTGWRDHPTIKHYTAIDFTGTTVYDSAAHCHKLALAGADSVFGIAPDCTLYSVKIYNTDANPKSTFDTIIRGIDWCIANHIQVACLTINVGTYAQLNSKINALYNSGCIIFCSTGNAHSTPQSSMSGMAQCDSSFAVNTWDPTLGVFSSTSSIHNKVMLMNTNEGDVGGTSQAASTTAFFAALMLQRYPSFSPYQLKSALQTAARLVFGYTADYTTPEGRPASDIIGTGQAKCIY